jgi:hypothetical protein
MQRFRPRTDQLRYSDVRNTVMIGFHIGANNVKRRFAAIVNK